MNLRSRRRSPPEIVLTPLIDVVFLMLIFFMVSTTFDKQAQIELQLPEADTATLPQEEEPESIEVTVDANGHYYVNQQELVNDEAETLERMLSSLAGGRSDLPLTISADGRASHESVVRVMDVASRLGMNRMSFATRQSSADSGSSDPTPAGPAADGN